MLVFWSTLIFFMLVQSGQSYQRVCYVSKTSYMPTVVVPKTLCTHIIFGFAEIDDRGIMVPTDQSDEQIYKELISMKSSKSDLQVLVSIQKGFDTIFKANLTIQTRFCESVVDFLDKYGFDGIDLDWEPLTFPLKPYQIQGYENIVRLLDKQRFHGLANVDRQNGGFLLTAALYASKPKASEMYNFSLLAEVMDFVTVMTYDYHLFIPDRDTVTGHNSPLYVETADPIYWSVNGTLYFYQTKIPISKIMLGFPTYGRTYELMNADQFGVGAPAKGPGDPGPVRKLKGVYSYQDVCIATQFGTPTFDIQSQVPYFHNGTTWLSFDNLQSISVKCKFLKEFGFGGVGIWALHLDDFSNMCRQGPFPLINAWKTCLQS